MSFRAGLVACVLVVGCGGSDDQPLRFGTDTAGTGGGAATTGTGGSAQGGRSSGGSSTAGDNSGGRLSTGGRASAGNAGSPDAAAPGCSNDFDCKGARVCVNGTCQDAPIGNGGAPQSTGGNGGTANTTGGTPSATGGMNGTGGTVDSGAGCGAVDIYILIDQSASMSCSAGSSSRWDSVKGALTSFVQNAGATMNVGIGYFGTAASPPGSSCVQTDYLVDAEIGSTSSAIVNSLNAHQPFTDTPTLPALQSALSHAADWKSHHAGHKVVVVLLTDGQPNACGVNNVNQVVSAASTALSSSGVPTYVLGIVSSGATCGLDPNQPSVSDLDRIADAGGTGTGFITDPSKSGFETVVLAKLNEVLQDAASSCGPSQCKPDQKLCGSCVSRAPSNGCGLTGCTPCSAPPPPNGVLACISTSYACEFQCLSGFKKQGDSCVPL